MSSIDTINKEAYLYCSSMHNEVIQLCLPLQYFYIKNFGYLKIFNNNSYLLLSNCGKDFLSKYMQKLCYVSHSFTNKFKQLSYFEPFYDLWPLNPVMDEVLQLLHDSNIWNGFNIYIRNNNYIEIFGFANGIQDHYTQSLCLNSVDKLKHFIVYFKYRSAHIVSDCQKQKKLAMFKEAVDINYDPNTINNTLKKREAFLNIVDQHTSAFQNCSFYN